MPAPLWFRKQRSDRVVTGGRVVGQMLALSGEVFPSQGFPVQE